MTIKDEISKALEENDLKKFTDLLIQLDEMIAGGDKDVEKIRDWAYRQADVTAIFRNQKIADYKKITDDAIKAGDVATLTSTYRYLNEEVERLEADIGRFMMEGRDDLAAILGKRQDIAREMMARIDAEMARKKIIPERVPTLRPEELKELKRGVRRAGYKLKELRPCEVCGMIVFPDEMVVKEGKIYHPECYETVVAEERPLDYCPLCGVSLIGSGLVTTIKGTGEFAHDKCIKEHGLE